VTSVSLAPADQRSIWAADLSYVWQNLRFGRGTVAFMHFVRPGDDETAAQAAANDSSSCREALAAERESSRNSKLCDAADGKQYVGCAAVLDWQRQWSRVASDATTTSARDRETPERSDLSGGLIRRRPCEWHFSFTSSLAARESRVIRSRIHRCAPTIQRDIGRPGSIKVIADKSPEQDLIRSGVSRSRR